MTSRVRDCGFRQKKIYINTIVNDVPDRCDVPGSVADNTKNSNSAANVPVGLYSILLMKIETGRAL